MKPDKTIGDYLIDSTLSKSGMSYVHLAYLPNQPNYKVALKIHFVSESPRNAYQDLLRHEAEHLARFRHPNVVRIFPLHLPTGKVLYCARAIELPENPTVLIKVYLCQNLKLFRPSA